MAKIEVIPATYDVLVKFYGKAPERTQKSYAIVDDGEIVSIVGVYRENGMAVLFSDSLPEVEEVKKKYAKAAVKSVKMLTPYMKDINEVVSVADEKKSRSQAFLEHFGFKNINGKYIWQTQ
jgi:hypothetical protein